MELRGEQPEWKKCPLNDGGTQITELLRTAEIHCPNEEVVAAGLPIVQHKVIEGRGRYRIEKTTSDPNGAVYLLDWYLRFS
jgi:hypothetical protein